MSLWLLPLHIAHHRQGSYVAANLQGCACRGLLLPGVLNPCFDGTLLAAECHSTSLGAALLQALEPLRGTCAG